MDFLLTIVAFLSIFNSIILPQRYMSFLSTQGTINESALTGEYIPSGKPAVFNNDSLVPPALAADTRKPNVLGASADQKHIEVDLTNQRLYAFEGATKVFDFPVSTGLWGRTPTGTFHIWTKLRYTLMTGGSQALGTYYYLPNVPYTMFFYNDDIPKWKGFGIHGTYWHNNFGHPMSHGCVNMKTEEIEQLYYWANPDLKGNGSINASADNPGTEIIIYGTAPDA